MKTIKIGFSKPNKFKIGAWLIQKWINKEYSHVYIRYIDDQGRDIVFQAAHGTVHPVLFTIFLKENVVCKEIDMEFSDLEYQEVRDFYYYNMGSKYDYFNLIKIVVYDLMIRFNLKINTNDCSGYICSELAAKMLKKVKNIIFNKSLNLVRPDDVEITLTNHLK